MSKADNSRLSGLWKIIFGRTTILIVLLLLQVLVLCGGFVILGRRILIMNYAVGFLEVFILMYIVNNRQSSSFKLMWIIFMLVAPIVGVAFYLFTRLQPGTRFIARRVMEQIDEQEPFLQVDGNVTEELYESSKMEAGLFKYIKEKGHYPVYRDAALKYFPLGEDKFKELVYQLEQAKDFIFMEYFIVAYGHMWDTVLNILKRKVQAGVEVRFMYDGTCTLALLPKNYDRYLERYGIKCRIFSPMMPFLSTHQNNRDHRKIVVIDGHTAFTGGINLADEYINEKERFGHWKDTAIMVKGRAVNSFTLMFLQMWNIRAEVPENYNRYMFRGYGSAAPDRSVKTGGYIAPYGDSPLDHEEVGEKVYMDILNTANDYVHIMTPYLILDEEMIDTIIFAAQRGVDVKLILPHIPDKKYAYWLARTHYKELIAEGVEIYEYTPGFVHAKVFTSDDEKAVVGTINLDFRSLYLHFECAAYIWKNPVVHDVESDFQKTLDKCQQITMQSCNEYNIIYRIIGRVLRFVAPLM